MRSGLGARRGGHLRRLELWFALGLIAIVVAGWLAANSPGRSQLAAVPIVNVGRLPGDTIGTAPRPGTLATDRAPRLTTAPPARSRSATALAPGSRLVLARFGVNAPIFDVTAPGGVMQVPQNPRELGWWSGGASPGGGHGNVVIVGHINYAGVTGALAVLPYVRPGDEVDILRGPTSAVYTVAAVRTYAKSRGLPPAIFASGGPEQLVLITCGGPFDALTGNYEDNIVAYATPKATA